MSETPVPSIEEHFGELEDGRKAKGKRHELMDIIVIAICGVICGAEGCPSPLLRQRRKAGWDWAVRWSPSCY